MSGESNASGGCPLSAEQLRFYNLHQLNSNSPELYLTWTLNFRGELVETRLKQSFQLVFESNPILFSIIADDGVGRKVMRSLPSQDFKLVVIDISKFGSIEKQRQLDKLIKSETDAEVAFVLESGPLYYCQLIKVSDTESVLTLRIHHIVCDLLSTRLVLAKVLNTYENLAKGGRSDPPSSATYGDFVIWEQSQADSSEAREQEKYWQGKLQDPGVIDLSLFKERPRVHTRKAQSIRVNVSAELIKLISEKCRVKGVTPYMFLLATFNLLLQKTTGQRDILVGSPVASRNEPEFAQMIGVLVNWIVFRNKIDPEQTFETFLAAVKQDAMVSIANQNVSLTKMAELVGHVPRDPGRASPFQVIFDFVKYDPLPQPTGLTVKADWMAWTETHFDLCLALEQQGSEFDMRLIYYEGALDEKTTRSLASAFLELLEFFANDMASKISQKILVGTLAGLPRPSAPERQVVVSSTFTADLIAPTLNFWSKKLRLNLKSEFGQLNQVFQDLIDSSSASSRNTLGVNAILLRFADWKDPAKHVNEFVELVNLKSKQGSVPTVVVCCPPPGSWQVSSSLMALNNSLEDRIYCAFEKSTSVHVIKSGDIVASYPVTKIDDAESDAYGKVPYTSEYFTALATMLARKIHSVLRLGPKVLVLDCDNTLWDGVVGEDGVSGIGLGPDRQKFQEMLVEQYKNGVLLCLSSKNNEADVWEVFDKRHDMKLKREHITAHRINWQPKSSNIVSMAAELNLGVDSFVFLDDNPVEISEVSSACPGVTAIQVPTSNVSGFSAHLWNLDLRKVTDADLKRAQTYAQNSQREVLKEQLGDISEFIKSLEVKVNFVPISEDAIPRVSQMTQRTNQFNSTTIRRTEAEIRKLWIEGKTQFLIVDVSDRFGDYGVVGLVVYRTHDKNVDVETFLLSCRALGRGVEQKILQKLAEVANSTSASNIRIFYRPSPKNDPIRQFLDGVASGYRQTLVEGVEFVYQIPTMDALSLVSKVVKIEFKDEDKKKGSAVVLPEIPSFEWSVIAKDLSTIERIETHLQSEGAQYRSKSSGKYVAPSSPVEIELARIWQDVLMVDKVGVTDNYFTLGGDSIRSLLIVSKMKNLGYSLKPLDVMKYPTIRELQAQVSRAQIVDSAKGKPAPALTYPISFMQAHMLRNYDLENRNSTSRATGSYHFQQSFEIHVRSGEVDINMLAQSLEMLSVANPMMQTHIEKGESLDDSVQVISPDKKISPTIHDISNLSVEEQDRFVDNLMEKDRVTAFDPYSKQGHVIRFSIIKKSDSTFELFGSAHHAFGDGWGYQEFLNRLAVVYETLKSGNQIKAEAFIERLKNLPNAYHEFVLLEKKLSSTRVNENWKAHLRGASGADSRNLSEESTRSRSRVNYQLDPSLVSKIESYARQRGISAKSVYLSAFLDMLAKDFDLSRPVVATVVNGRTDELSDATGAFGLFWRFLPLSPLRHGDRSLQIRDVHKSFVMAEENSTVSMEKVLNESGLTNALAGSFNYIHFYNSKWFSNESAFELSNTRTFDKFHFPLNLKVNVVSAGGPAELSLTWNSKRVSSKILDSWFERYTAELLNAVESAKFKQVA